MRPGAPAPARSFVRRLRGPGPAVRDGIRPPQTGEIHPMQEFVSSLCLGASSLTTFAEATRSQKLANWPGLPPAALLFALPSAGCRRNRGAGINLRSALAQDQPLRAPEHQPQLRDLAEHSGVAVVPARSPRSRRDKAKAEVWRARWLERWITRRPAAPSVHLPSAGELTQRIAVLLGATPNQPTVSSRKTAGSRQSPSTATGSPALRPLQEQLCPMRMEEGAGAHRLHVELDGAN